MSNQPAYLRGRGRGRGVKPERPPQQTTNVWTQGRGRSASRNGGTPSRPGRSPNSNANFTTDELPSSPAVESERLGSCLRNVEDMFAKARSEHMRSAQRLLESNNQQEEGDSSEDEEDDIGSLVLNGVFKSYASTFENGTSEDIQSAQEKLLHSFRSGTAACLVCIETIKKDEAIWSCTGCFCMFHITCIQKWVREGIYHKQYASGELDTDKPTENIPWQCPKCRHEYHQKECPTHYYCFCGKQRDPKFDPWIVPHSCGAVCGRKIQPACGHTCLLLCHPGACPPCPVTVKSMCHCGASAPRMMRCSAKLWACGKVCGRTLSCKQHKCPQKCHPGDCPPCTKTSIQSCLCGREKAQRACDSVSWQCENVCNKALNCGNHVCEKICHQGPCGDCPRSGPRKCPCGKTDFTLPCTEDIPTCGDTCGKHLSCGQHSCTQRCHTGNCGQCVEVAVKKCRCGQKQKQIACTKEFICDKKCPNLRDCGVHKCNRKCCEGNCPSCEQICGKSLKCRNHKCASRCHKGPCYPCPLTVDIPCHCKKTKVTVPCGKERDTRPPRCNFPCTSPPVCHHPSRQKHRCHFDNCPPCNFVCGLKLKGCEHTCPVMCHDAVRVRIEDKSAKAGPWEVKPVRIETVKKHCPPCVVPMPIQCLGLHETSDVPCSQLKPYSCGRKCGKQLACGNHTCQSECHTVSGAEDSSSAGKECSQCDRGCEIPRPDGCTHSCLKPCHPPPCKPCRMMIRMQCHCQVVMKHIECNQWLRATEAEKIAMKACGQPCPKEMPCGHPCGAPCHPGPCPNINDCNKKITLKCRCKRIKKDIVCKDKATSSRPECDEICQTNKKPDPDTELKKEEEKRKEAELQEFERMMKGRRRKPRKHHEEVVEESRWSRYKVYIMPIIIGIVGIICTIYLMQAS